MVRLSLAMLLVLSACGAPGDAASGAQGSMEPPPLPAATAKVGRCAAVDGTVEVHREGLPYWDHAENGTELRVGDWVRTGPGAAVRLEFDNGARLDVDDNAVVIVEVPEAPAAGSTEPAAPTVAVARGTVRGVAGTDEETAAPVAPIVLKSGGQTQRVEGVAGKRTDFRVRATDTGTEIAVTKGRGVVRQGSQSVELTEGRATVAAGTLSGPVEVPDFPISIAPGIDARAVFPLAKPLFLTWKPVAIAVGYRVQIARDLSFSADAVTHDVKGTSFEVKPDGRGLYAWRVASRAANGVVGEFGFARRIYFEGEQPIELLLTPEDAETYGYATTPPKIVFQWQAAAGAQSYRLQVSKTGDPMVKPVVTETTEAQRLEVSALTAGEYTWGVYVRPGMKPIFLSPRKLTIKQMAKPKVKAPSAIQWE